MSRLGGSLGLLGARSVPSLSELLCLGRSAESLLTWANLRSNPDSYFQSWKPVSQSKTQTEIFCQILLCSEANLFSRMCTSSCSAITEYFLLAYRSVSLTFHKHRFGSSISDAQKELNLHFLHRVEVFGLVTSLLQISWVAKDIFLWPGEGNAQCWQRSKAQWRSAKDLSMAFTEVHGGTDKLWTNIAGLYMTCPPPAERLLWVNLGLFWNKHCSTLINWCWLKEIFGQCRDWRWIKGGLGQHLLPYPEFPKIGTDR